MDTDRRTSSRGRRVIFRTQLLVLNNNFAKYDFNQHYGPNTNLHKETNEQTGRVIPMYPIHRLRGYNKVIIKRFFLYYVSTCPLGKSCREC